MIKTFLAFVFLLTLPLTYATSSNLSAHHENEEAVSTRAQVESVIKDYLENHPQAVYQALIKYRNQEMAKQERYSKDAVIEHYDALFNSKSPSFGSPRAKVTVVEFMDYDCAHCKIVGPRLTALAQSGQLRVIVKHLPIRGKTSLYSSQMALAANKQGKFEPVYEALLKAENITSDKQVDAIAEKAGVDLKQAKADMNQFQSEIDDNFKLATQLKLQGTPSLIFSNGNPKTAIFVPGAVSDDTLKSIIKDLHA